MGKLYEHLSAEERVVIMVMWSSGSSVRWQQVVERLRWQWSPEQIAATLGIVPLRNLADRVDIRLPQDANHLLNS